MLLDTINRSIIKSNLCTLVPLQILVHVLVVNTLLSGATTSIGTARSLPVLHLALTNTARVVLAANVRIEAGVVLGVAVESTLVQVLALRLAVAQLTSHIGNIRRRLARVVLARVTTSVGRAGTLAQLLRSRILALRSVKILFRACGAAHITVSVDTREITLATKGLRVPFLSVDVLALSTDRGGRKLGGSRCVGVVQG